MSLEGSIQTFALPEVVNLLADTSKSGELRVTGPHAGGRLWFAAGELSGFEAGRCEQAVDALFDLLRMDDGEFVFETGAGQPADATRRSDEDAEAVMPTDIRPLLQEAQTRLAEWGEIVAVVPSLAHEIYLVGDAPEGGVTLEASQWSMVVAIGDGRSVQAILDDLHLPEFAGCKALKQLVATALVEVVDPETGDETEAGTLDAGPLDTGTVAPGTVDPGATIYAIARDVDASHDAASSEARVALSALLDGIPPAVSPTGGPDGLVDRGPWSADELATLDRPDADSDAHSDEESGAELGDADNPNDAASVPINRGLLLKFLSSVRS